MYKGLSDMRYLLLFALTLKANFLFSQENYQEKMQKYRDSIDLSFSDSATSILKVQDRLVFHGLNYFPVNEKYVVKAEFIKIDKGKIFEMITTTSRRPVYFIYGKLVFQIDSQAFELFLYKLKDPKDGYENWLFCPFSDLTNGEETYGGGRYLDFTIDDMKNPVIDFNLCYNPYCAYNDRYSCPVPPKENFLNIRVEAGVKKFHE